MNVAASDPDPEWLKIALKHGGDPDVVNSGNRQFPKRTPLFYAATAGRAQNVALLIEAGADLDHIDAHGINPLRRASEAGAYNCVVELLLGGADPYQRDNFGYSAFDWFHGRDESLVINESQKVWFRKAAELLENKKASNADK
jgi:hypothetical protein